MLYCVCGCVAVWLWLWCCGWWLCAAVVAAAVMRKDPKRGYVTDATPRRSGFQRMLESNRTTGTVSGSGVDKGIGQHADVLLGLWSCCRNVDPVMQGCVRAEAHTRTMLKCRQCGVFYNHLDNQSSKLRGAPNCSYHPREPQTGTLVARTFVGKRGGLATANAWWPREQVLHMATHSGRAVAPSATRTRNTTPSHQATRERTSTTTPACGCGVAAKVRVACACATILALTPERCCATVLGMRRLPRPIRGVTAS